MAKRVARNVGRRINDDSELAHQIDNANMQQIGKGKEWKPGTPAEVARRSVRKESGITSRKPGQGLTSRRAVEIYNGKANSALAMPSIDEVCLAFHHFQQGAFGAIARHRIGSKEQMAALEAVREQLRDKLTELGLAEHIDWASPEG